MCTFLILWSYPLGLLLFFFFNDTATTEIYTLSLHDALPISCRASRWSPPASGLGDRVAGPAPAARGARSEEHTSELQSQSNLVCRLLLEKKKQENKQYTQKDIKALDYMLEKCHLSQ